MKLKWIFFLFSMTLVNPKLSAQSSSSLFLRAFIPRSIGTSVKSLQLNSTQTLWLLKSQINAEYPLEGQKFEVEGLKQAGVEAELKLIVSNERTIQHEILISHLKSSIKSNKNIFLKISAN